MRHRRPTGFIPFILGALCALGILAAGASAAPPVQIDEFACEAGNACNGATTFNPQSVAVDETGDVYVVDREHNLVDRFHADGSYASQITNGSFELGGVEGQGIAVDNSGNLYVGGKNGNAYAYDPSGSLLWEKPGIIGTKICDVAVDPSGGPWIADREDEDLVELDPDTGEKTGATITLEGINACKFAFRASDAIVAASLFGPLGEYEADGTFLRMLHTEPEAETYGVAVDPTTDSVFASGFKPFDGAVSR